MGSATVFAVAVDVATTATAGAEASIRAPSMASANAFRSASWSVEARSILDSTFARTSTDIVDSCRAGTA